MASIDHASGSGERTGSLRLRTGGRRRRRGGVARATYAALDLGTNNCRLLVARPVPGGFRVIDAFSRIVRLGEGLGASGRLSVAAMERTLAALRVCAAKMRRRGVTHARAVATAACREASNCADFLDRVRDETGLELDIISTDEEARLAVAGCASLLDPAARRVVVFDIGGGSTELTLLDRDPSGRSDLAAWTSLPMGVVSLAERYGGDLIPPALYWEMVAEVEALLTGFAAGAGANGDAAAMQMLGTSGTVTTLAGVHLKLPRYDRARVDGLWLSFDAAAEVSARLRAMRYEERAAHPCIGRERADLVVAGCAILEAICRTWPVGRLRVADRGVREGILLSLMGGAGGTRGPAWSPA